jgi:hypothetical protein
MRRLTKSKQVTSKRLRGAKRLLKNLEKALAIHVADRDRLTKRLARTPR